jgi:aspartate/methionine/tyrosine aminotransferase
MSKVISPSKRASNLESTLRDLAAEARKLKPKLNTEGKKLFFFNIGDPNKFDFDTPQYLKDALIESLKKGAGYYSSSEGDIELIKAIIKRENKKNDMNLTEEDVIVTAGVSEGLHFIFEALCEPGDEVLLPGPSYPPYIQHINLAGAKAIPYRTDEENGWDPDPDDLRKKINDKTKAISIVNPNNPTGAVYSKSRLKAFVDVALENEVLLLTDEIYDKMIFGKNEHIGLASLVKNGPLVGFNGFSKIYLSPGWRCGYMYFHDPTDILGDLKYAVLQLARQRLCISTPIMKACTVAYSGPQDHIIETNKKLKKRAEFAYKRLNEIDGIETQKPEGAFYIFPKVDMEDRWKSDKEFSLDVLRNTGLVLPHGSGFCPIYGKNHFRSVILPQIEVMDEAFGKLEEFMKKK